MTVTAEMIYDAFCSALGSRQPWSTVPLSARTRYEAMAMHLNSALQHAEVCHENDDLDEKPVASARSKAWQAAIKLASTPGYHWHVQERSANREH